MGCGTTFGHPANLFLRSSASELLHSLAVRFKAGQPTRQPAFRVWRELLAPPLLLGCAFALTISAGRALKAVPTFYALDVQLYRWINGLSCGLPTTDPFYNALWLGLNQPSLNYIVIYAILAGYVMWRRRKEWLRLVFVGLWIATMGYASNIVVWSWAWAPRPFLLTEACILHPEWETIWSAYSSFPSGHARETASELTALVTFWTRIWPLATLYFILLGFSRVYIGVHFVSDVVIGAALGWAIAQTAFLAYNAYVPRIKKLLRGITPGELPGWR